jgi:hypothetical protein
MKKKKRVTSITDIRKDLIATDEPGVYIDPHMKSYEDDPIVQEKRALINEILERAGSARRSKDHYRK